MNALEISGLEKRFKSFQLGPIDINVPAGVIYGFVGPNGSGKTTTIDLIFGMGAKDAGTITVLGLDHLRDEVAMKRQVGYVSPDLNYQPWGKVGKAIQFVKGFYPSWDDDYCARLMDELDLGLNERILSLSFGARIKLSLVLALSWRPKLIILDEPTVGLDAISKQKVFAELMHAVAQEGRTVFISSHNLTDLERIADHVGMIRNGRMLFEGHTSDVIDRYRMVDFRAPASDTLGAPAGLFVQRKEAGRWRALVDLRHLPLERLRDSGASDIAASSVTLEEIFVALGQAS